MDQMLTRLVVCFPLFLAFASCNSEDPPTGSDGQFPSDNPAMSVTPFVIEQIRGFKNSYSLDDSVIWTLTLANYSCLSPFHVRSGIDPPWKWSVSAAACDTVLAYQPTWRPPSCWSGNLEPGDSLCFRLAWDLAIPYRPDHSFHFGALKAYSGTYLIKTTIGTNTPVLTKYITITDVGDPLSALAFSRSTSDSIIIDLIARNRISSDLQRYVDGPLPITLICNPALGPYDTLLVRSLAFPQSSIVLSAHSDRVIFTFAVARTDSTLDALPNVYWITVALRMVDRELISWPALVTPMDALRPGRAPAP
jgi:hypothetical protein